MMRRREFITLIGGAAMVWPFAAWAQDEERVRRIGVLMSNAKTDPEASARIGALERGLQKLGWSQGRNISIAYRWNVTDSDSIRTSVRDLIDLNPDLFLAHTPATVAALKQAARTTPIVFVQASDPVTLRLVTNLASSGSNVTGFVLFETSLGGTWLQLLRDVAPGIKQVLVIQSADNPSTRGFLRSIERVASSLKVSLRTADVGDFAEIKRAINELASSDAGVIVLPSPEATAQREQIIGLATLHRLPAIYPFKYYAISGGLLFYGADNVDQWRQAASYVDRILRGAEPRDLPIQLPTKFDLVINLKAAGGIGLNIPRDVLLLADEVIE
jgi:putative ABC transport system substrate-binding protein